MVGVFETSLRLLSPFMPFLTEEVWHAVYDGKPPAKSIALTRFPLSDGTVKDTSALEQMEMLQALIVEIRALRKDVGVDEKATVPIELRLNENLKSIVTQNSAIVERLARVAEIRFVDQISAGHARHATSQFDEAVVYERKIDVAAECEKLSKEIAKQEKNVGNADRQLGNPAFTSKAPPHIVEGLKKQRVVVLLLLVKLRSDRDSLSC